MPVVKIFIGVLLAIWNFFLPNIHQNYELPKTHPFIAKNTVTVLLLVVKMPCTPYLNRKLRFNICAQVLFGHSVMYT